MYGRGGERFGFAQFPAAFLNKAGGYTLVARTTGTISTPDAELGDAPSVPAGSSVASPLVNVKNGTISACGHTYTEGQAPPNPADGNLNGFAAVE